MVPQKETIMTEESILTLSVPAAGKKYFGLSRNGAYDAAARGDLPTIRIGRLLRVPVRALEAMLNEAGQRRETERA
jgi:Helix-turn-helix domain